MVVVVRALVGVFVILWLLFAAAGAFVPFGTWRLEQLEHWRLKICVWVVGLKLYFVSESEKCAMTHKT